MVARTGPWGRTIVVCAAVLGCGGGGEPPPSCLQVQPCGGDLVGTWRIVGACQADPSVITAGAPIACAGYVLNSVGASATGAIRFNADFTYTVSHWDTRHVSTYSYPQSCAGGIDCVDLSDAVTYSDGSYSKLICGGTTVCTCQGMSLGVIDESGSYGTAGTEFQMISPTTSRNRTYCVDEISAAHRPARRDRHHRRHRRRTTMS